MAKGKRASKDILNSTKKTKHRATRTLLTAGDELRCSGSVSNSCSASNTRHVNTTKWHDRNNCYALWKRPFLYSLGKTIVKHFIVIPIGKRQILLCPVLWTRKWFVLSFGQDNGWAIVETRKWLIYRLDKKMVDLSFRQDNGWSIV